MAYLSPPLTIIDNRTNIHNPILSVPPAATWFDEDRQHFVALKGIAKDGWAADSVASGSIDYSELAGGFYSVAADEYESTTEVVQYQAFRLPEDVDQRSSDIPDESKLEQSAFDAAKKIARGRGTLITEVSVAFPLPRKLTNIYSIDDASSSSEPDKTVPARRIPILAKFSELVGGVRFLALQYTSTMVRIIDVSSESSNRGEKHWTIDLSYGIHPVACAPDELASFREGREIDTAIIGGGVIWCKGANNALNLLLITTTSVIIYEMNTHTNYLAKSRVYPHRTATSFWFEAASRVLMIGSYRANDSDVTSFPKIVMEMKTLFFTENDDIKTFPSFVVGSPREDDDNGEGTGIATSATLPDGKQRNERNVVLPTDISLVCLHGDVFCVELGSLGSRRGIGLIKLDRTNMFIHVRQHETKQPTSTKLTFVGVVDNLLCIINRESKSTSFLDVPALFSDDEHVFKEIISTENSTIDNGVGMHDRSLSFLAPKFFLHTDGEGLLYEIKLDVLALLRCIPSSTCVVPFLLQRCSESRQTMLTCIIKRFDIMVEKKDLETLKGWLRIIALEYSKSDAAIKYDLESTDNVLLSASSLLDVDTMPISDVVAVPNSCKVLTQAEILQFVLIKHAKLAMQDPNSLYFENVSSMATHYIAEVERSFVNPCFALQCIVITLLVKQQKYSDLTSYLNARESQWIQVRRKRQMNLPTPNGMHFDLPEIATTYAQILFRIATTCCTHNLQHQKVLISHATSILIGCNDNMTAVRCLLSAGYLEDAIAVCVKKVRQKDNAEDVDDIVCATDLFDATTSKARNTTSLAEKCMLFYNLQCILRQKFPDAFTNESRKVKIPRPSSTGRIASFSSDNDTVTIEQSKLAHEKKFPDDMFGGSNTTLCRKIRAMFGYFNSSQS